MLNNLNLRDVMSMVDNSEYVKIKKEKDDKAIFINSYVTERIKDKRSIYSYLCTVKEKGRVTIYCQLSVTDEKDPRHAILLKNLLKLTDVISDSRKNQTISHRERRQL